MWEQLDPDDLRNALTEPELDLMNQDSSIALSPDRMLQVLGWVVSRVRGKVAAYPTNADNMGPEETIPEELYSAAIHIARYDLLTSFPQGNLFIDAPRARAYEDALKQLDDVAKGLLVVEPFGAVLFSANPVAFGSRDDDVANRSRSRSRDGSPSRNLIPFDFWF